MSPASDSIRLGYAVSMIASAHNSRPVTASGGRLLWPPDASALLASHANRQDPNYYTKYSMNEEVRRAWSRSSPWILRALLVLHLVAANRSEGRVRKKNTTAPARIMASELAAVLTL